MLNTLLTAALKERESLDAWLAQSADLLQSIATSLANTLKSNNTIFWCGNGGSAADAQHMAAELTGRFKKERKALSSIALTTDTSALTAIANDYSYDEIFSRQLEGLGRQGDALISLSSSGNSENLCLASKLAKSQGIATIGLLGKDGGKLAPLVDYALVVPSQTTARIQEMHTLISHLLCEFIDEGY